MVVLNVLISVYHGEPEFSMIGSPIHLIAILLINWIGICMYSQFEYCSKSPLKITSNGLNERNLLYLHHFNIHKHDDSYVKTLIFVVALR